MRRAGTSPRLHRLHRAAATSAEHVHLEPARPVCDPTGSAVRPEIGDALRRPHARDLPIQLGSRRCLVARSTRDGLTFRPTVASGGFVMQISTGAPMRWPVAAALAGGLLSACSGVGTPATSAPANEFVRANRAAA